MSLLIHNRKYEDNYWKNKREIRIIPTSLKLNLNF